MDPNETLRRLRNVLVDVNDTETGEGERFEELALEAHGLFFALDEWLSRKGFLPDDWNPGQS